MMKKTLKQLGTLVLSLCMVLTLVLGVGGVEANAASATNAKNTATLTVNPRRNIGASLEDKHYWKWNEGTTVSGNVNDTYTGTMKISCGNEARKDGVTSLAKIAIETGWTKPSGATYQVVSESNRNGIVWSFRNLTITELNEIIAHCWIYTEGFENDGTKSAIVSEKVEFIVSIRATTFLNTHFNWASDPFTSVTSANYRNILASKADYDNLSDIDKADVDRALYLKTSSGTAVTYEALYNEAMEMDLPVLKNAAKDDIDQKAARAVAAINGMQNLSDNEKEAYIQDINTKATAYKNRVDQASSVAAVNTEKSDFDAALEGVKTNATNKNADNLARAKTAARTAINAAASEAKESINSKQNLTAEEKAAFCSQIDTAVGNSINGVNSATTIANVNTLKDAFNLTAIKNEATAKDTENLSSAKTEARSAIEAAKEAAKTLIRSKENITEAVKESFVEAVEAVVRASKGSVDNAQTVAAVTSAKTSFDSELERIKRQVEEEDADNLARAKTAARSAINTAASAAKELINNNANLTAEEKADFIRRIETAVTDNIANVNSAANVAEVNAAEEAFNGALDAIKNEANTKATNNLASAKTAAETAINGKAEVAKAFINSKQNLTAEEKEDLLGQIEAAVQARKARVNSAVTVAAVDGEKNSFALTSITDEAATKDAANLQAAKDNAKSEIEQAVTEAKAKINSKNNLTAAEKEDLLAKVEKAAQDKKKDIDDATTIQGVKAAKAQFDAAILTVQETAELKDNQNKANADATVSTDAAKAEIDSMTGLSDAEKTELKKQIDQATDAVTEEIQNATTVQAVNTAKDALNKALDLIKNKAEQMKEMNRFAADEIENIEKNENLSEKEKEELITAVKKSTADTTKAIMDASEVADIAPLLAEGKEKVAADLKYVSAMEFANKYLRAAFGGKIYNEVDTNNIDQLLSGKEAWAKLDADNQAKVNEMMKADTADKYGKYEDYFVEAEKFAEESANDFIKKYLTRENGSVVVKAAREDVDMILAAEKIWNALSETEKTEVNAMLAKAGATQTFEKILSDAKQILEDVANSFIKDNLLDKDANKDNYQKILNSKKEWDKLTQTEKDKVNSILKEKYGKTYEEFIAKAEKIDKQVKSAKTGDGNAIMQWCILTLMAGICMFSTVQYKKKNR